MRYFVVVIGVLLLVGGCFPSSSDSGGDADVKPPDPPVSAGEKGLPLPADSVDSEAPPKLPDESGSGGDGPPGIFG